MNLRIEKVTKKNSDLKKIKELFISSFPKKQRGPFWLVLLASKMKEINFLSFYDKDILCGFIYTTIIDNITFVVWLAVSSNVRSKGYGSAILNEIQSMYKDNKIILYIDKCDEEASDYEKRIKRKSFYIKNGYEETGYLVETRKMVEEVLIKNGSFDKEEFEQFFKKQSNGMVKVKLFKI